MEHKDFSIARLKRNGEVFEIIINSELALKARRGEGSVEDALLVNKIFKNARTGDVHGDLKSFFGTNDVIKIAEEIINKGVIQLSEDYRRKVVKDKYNRIINELVSKASDPNTHYPIPRQRIELAIEKIGYKVRFDKTVKEQVSELMPLLKKAMPVSFNDFMLTITSPSAFSGQTYGIVKGYGEVISQNYLPDGSLIINARVSAAGRSELIDKLKKLSHGLIKIKED